ncbi:MAG: hypothetical protein ACKVHE_20565 [Planctomycetales bacterium]
MSINVTTLGNSCETGVQEIQNTHSADVQTLQISIDASEDGLDLEGSYAASTQSTLTESVLALVRRGGRSLHG